MKKKTRKIGNLRQGRTSIRHYAVVPGTKHRLVKLNVKLRADTTEYRRVKKEEITAFAVPSLATKSKVICVFRPERATPSPSHDVVKSGFYIEISAPGFWSELENCVFKIYFPKKLEWNNFVYGSLIYASEIKNILNQLENSWIHFHHELQRDPENNDQRFFFIFEKKKIGRKEIWKKQSFEKFQHFFWDAGCVCVYACMQVCFIHKVGFRTPRVPFYGLLAVRILALLCLGNFGGFCCRKREWMCK